MKSTPRQTPEPMPSNEEVLHDLRRALDELARADTERARAWAFSALFDAPERRAARMEAEREFEDAREKLRHAKEALVSVAAEEKAWSGH